MPVSNTQEKPRLSDELTVVLLRGNGSPRSFRFSLSAFNRTVAALGFTFAAALLACLVLGIMMLVKPAPTPPTSRTAPSAVAVLPVPAATATQAPGPNTPPATTAPVASAPVTPPPAPVVVPAPVKSEVAITPAPPAPTAAPETKGGFWSRLTGGGAAKTASSSAASPTAPAASDSELQKEVEGLRADVARLGSQLEGRKNLPAGKSEGLLQFFGAGSTLVPESESGMRVKNPKVGKDGKQITLDFELHNVNPDQRQERGYIVALAKAPDALVSYPAGVFATSQNIVLDYTKGETFAVSRFRQARATFPAASLDGKKVTYQVLLFGTDGKVLATLNTGAN